MTAAQWKELRGTLTVREVRRTISRPGFRPVTLTIVTTLLDARKYPADELFTLRLRRWDVETDIRHLKTTMGMEILHCQTVEGVQKELWMFLLIYNLVRAMMAATNRQKVAVDRISFASALDWMRCARAGDPLPPAGSRSPSSQSHGAPRHQAATQTVRPHGATAEDYERPIASKNWCDISQITTALRQTR